MLESSVYGNTAGIRSQEATENPDPGFRSVYAKLGELYGRDFGIV